VDLFAILQSLRRHWLVATAVGLLTVLAAGAILVLMPRQYEAKASYILVNPPPAPTEAEIAADPASAEINRNNPYLRFANQATMGEVLASRVSGETVRRSLIEQGADLQYRVAPSTDFGGSGLLLDLIGTGTDPAQADATLALVTQRLEDELYAMQKVYGADDSVLITALPVAEPTGATLVVSGLARSLVGVGAAGVIALFSAISIAEARRSGRRLRTTAADEEQSPAEPPAHVEPAVAPRRSGAAVGAHVREDETDDRHGAHAWTGSAPAHAGAPADRG
jgi:hypothetical protein